MPSVDDRDRRSGTGPNSSDDDSSEPTRAAPEEGTQVVRVDVVLPRPGRTVTGDMRAVAAPLPQGKRPTGTAEVIRRPTSGEGPRRTATGDMRATAAPSTGRKPMRGELAMQPDPARARKPPPDLVDDEFTAPLQRLPPLATDPSAPPIIDEPAEGSTSLNALPERLLPLKPSSPRDPEPEENHTSVNQIPADELLPPLPGPKGEDDGLQTGLNMLPARLKLPPLPDSKVKPGRKPTRELAVPWSEEPPAPLSKRAVVAPAPAEPVSKRGAVAVPASVPPGAPAVARRPTRSEVPVAPEVPVPARKPTRGEMPVVPPSVPPGPQSRKPTRGEIPIPAPAPRPEPKSKPEAEPEAEPEADEVADLESTDTAPLPVLRQLAAGKGLRNAKLLDIETGEVDVRGFPGGIKPVEEMRSTGNQAQGPAKRPRVEDLLTGLAPVGDLEVDRPTSVPEQRSKAPRALTGALKKVASMTGMHVFGGEEEVRSLTGLARLEPSKREGFQVVLMGFFLFVGLGVAVHFYFSGPEKPALEELQMLYPFHFQGGTLPSGRTAPGAESVKFDYKGIVTCGASQCLQYEAQGEDGVFALPMILRHDGSVWVLVENHGH